MNRSEHLAWCKQRALEYLDQGDTKNALASMFSDLSKHEETRDHDSIQMGTMLMMVGRLNTVDEVRKYIMEFN